MEHKLGNPSLEKEFRPLTKTAIDPERSHSYLSEVPSPSYPRLHPSIRNAFMHPMYDSPFSLVRHVPFELCSCTSSLTHKDLTRSLGGNRSPSRPRLVCRWNLEGTGATSMSRAPRVPREHRMRTASPLDAAGGVALADPTNIQHCVYGLRGLEIGLG